MAGTRKLRPGWLLAVAALAVVAMLGTGRPALADPKDPGAGSTTGSAARPATLAAANCGNNGADKRYSREEVLRRARSWLHNTQGDTAEDPINYQGDSVPYSQQVCHANGYGSYRTDCSGFVAMAWGMGGQGDDWWTGNLRPAYSGGRTVAIAQSQLTPGDALLRHEGNPDVDHIGLFVRWAGGGALVYEQTGATDRPRVAVWSMSRVNLYTPIRYTKMANMVVSGQFGNLNLVGQSGNLAWYKHNGWSDGTANWGPQYSAGTGFAMFDKLVGDGMTLFGITTDGFMRWYRYSPDTGFDPASGTIIGTGWNGMKFVVSAGFGVIYGITYTGELKWYRYNGVPGHGGLWVANSGKVIGTGWQGFRSVTASGGVFYPIEHNGNLHWYRYLSPNDAAGTAWAAGAGRVIGTAWNAEGGCGLQTVMAGGDGRIYAADASGILRWHRQLDPNNGGTSWATVTPCGNVIGTGWL